jgi:hypothetical protein
MIRNSSLVRLTALAATVTALVTGGARTATAQSGASQDKDDKPVTPRQVGKNVQAESKRVYKRSEKAVRKAGKDTKKQTQRTGKHVARTVSPAERERQEAEKKGTP